MKAVGSLKILFVFSVCLVSALAQGTAYISTEEAAALRQFRPLVSSLLRKDYEKLDIYLVHWLRARNLDVKAAKQMLEEHKNWRKENRVDGILGDKTIQNYTLLYPAEFGTASDKQGRPAYQTALGKWDLRKGYLNGHNFARYFMYSFERIIALTYGGGHSEWNFLVDMSGYNARQHACLLCLQFYIDLVNMYEKNYPNTARTILLVNTPRTFEAILQIITRLMSPHTRRVMKVFGVDKAEWQPIILKEFNASKLTRSYGGSKAI